MAWNAKTDSVTGVMKFQLLDDDGDSVASFKLNPTDIRLPQRFEEVGEYFGNLAKNAPEQATAADVQRYNDELEEKLCYLLGGNCRESLFGAIPAISIMPSGKLFVLELFDKLTEVVGPEIVARRQKAQNAVEKYTGKYSATLSPAVMDSVAADHPAPASIGSMEDIFRKFLADQLAAMSASK